MKPAGKKNLPDMGRIEKNSPKIAILLISVVAILAYSNTFSSSFHFDDVTSITDNSKIKALDNFWPPSGNRYIGLLSFAFNHYLGGLNVFGYHIVNLIIHITNGLLIYWLVLLTLRTPAMKCNGEISKHMSFTALLSALIFIAHPIQTQAVTYIAQRFTSLATLFYLLSLVTYVKSRLLVQSYWSEHWRLVRNHQSWRLKTTFYYLTSMISTLLAMKTKEISFTLPFIIVLYEFAFFNATRSSSSNTNMRTNIVRVSFIFPYLVTLIIIPLSLIGIEKPAGDMIGELRKATQETEQIPRDAYLLTQFRAIVTYTRLLFLPINQNLDYDYPIYHAITPQVFLSLFFLLLILALAIYLFYKSRAGDGRLRLIAFGIFWFFITLSVESSLIPIRDVIMEHRLYLPSVGMMIAFSSTLLLASDYLRPRYFSSFSNYLMLTVTVFSLSVVTYYRNFTWADEVTLWEDVVQKSPNKARGHNNLALAYYLNGQLERALRECTTALSLKPDYAEAYNNRGVAYAKQGHLDEAIKEITIALNLKPDYAEAHNNLGNIFYYQKRPDDAIREYMAGVYLQPDSIQARYNLAMAYKLNGLNNKAKEQLEIILALKPDFEPAQRAIDFLDSELKP